MRKSRGLHRRRPMTVLQGTSRFPTSKWRPATGLQARGARITRKPVAGRHEGARFPRTAAFRFANPSYAAISDVLLSARLSSGLQNGRCLSWGGSASESSAHDLLSLESRVNRSGIEGHRDMPGCTKDIPDVRFAEAAPLSRLSGSFVRLPCAQNDGFHEEHCMVY